MIMFIFIILTIISLFIFIMYKITDKGKRAEILVHYKLRILSDEYHIIDNVLFESNDRSTQIDHIVISPYGVFVIETKGYKGRIRGGEDSEYWTQEYYNYKKSFYNPILQNQGHVRFLSYLMLI